MTVQLLTRGYISQTQKIVQQVPLSPSEGQSLLVKSLELPLPPSMTTEALGIHQSDVIIRSAIIMAIADLRANPWLLDYVFASLPRDSHTMKDYGEKEVQRAKEWFMKTNIPVFMVPRLDEAKVPCITIKLQDSAESEVTLGDVHYQEKEDNDTQWPALIKPFTPEKYNAATGIMVVSQDVLDSIVLAPGMVIVDAVGKPHDILEVFDDGSFTIKQGTMADFTNSVVKGAKPSYITRLESVSYRETYQIGVHVAGEPVYLTWLHSIIVFILLRYKQALMEARGFERSVFNSSDFDRNEMFEAEMVFSRYLTLTGYVRQYWPKDVNPKITSFQPQPIRVIGADKLPQGTDPNDQLWIGDNDTLTPKK
jgi:hypothetical protein